MATILIVDDLSANRQFLVTILRGRGHRLLEAADGSAGLAAARTEHLDLIITDVLMPMMDGYEFVRQLRLDPATSGIPVLFYTASYGEREARALAKCSGVPYVLTKPGKPEEVLRIVGRMLAGETLPEMPPNDSASAHETDREHLQLLSDKLSLKAEDLRTANARLRAVINIGLELASKRDTEQLLESVCAAAHDLFGATYVTLGIINPNDRTVQRFVTCREGETECWIKAGDSVSGLLGTVMGERRTLRGDNPGGDPASLQLPLNHPKVQAFLAAPIASPTTVYGWICLIGNEGKSFTDDDEQLLMALSGQVGRIYEIEHEILERKQAESALRVERDSAQRYLDTAETILLALDSAGRITLVNRYACSILGWKADELLGRDWIDTCVPVRIRGALRKQFQSLVTGDLSIIENVVLTRSGAEYLIEWRNTLLRDDAGDVLGTFSSGSDITERKHAEEESRHRAALSALGAAIGLSLTDTQSISDALQQCAEALVTHLGAAFARIWTLNEREAMLELQASAGLYRHLDGPHGRVPVGQFKIGRIARDRKPHLTNSVIGDPQVNDQDWAQREGMVAFAGHPLIVDGRVVGVMALFARHALSDAVMSALASVADHIALGIERHRSTEALRTGEERMRFALAAANVGIWDMDYTTGAHIWSETLEAQYGLKPGAFGGTFESFVELIHPDDRESVLDTVGIAMKAGSDFSVQHRTLWADGTVRWVHGSGRIHLGENGEPVRAVGISLDITDRRALEEQYLQAQKMEAIGQLAGGVAHDFNNLLTAILGYCELLLVDFAPSDPRRSDIVEIHNAGTSAAELTRQLLAFSRKEIIELTLIDLNEVAGGMRALLGRLIGEDVRIGMALRPDLALVKADRGQVEQIIVNLAVNARDAMPTGGSLTIETANVELDEHYPNTHLSVKPGLYVVLTVTDTGTGMTPQVQARVFEPFYTTKEPGKGTGLGLATVHGIVTRSGGTIHIYSEVGKGTSIKVYFPRAHASERVADVPAPAERLHAGGQRILMVEDAMGLRELTRRLLERQGYTVLVAANMDEALVLFEADPAIDVLLTDVVMPGGSGPELTRRLVELRPGLKVIYMSGYTEEAIVHHGVLNPGVAFLHKPFTSESLGRKIREVLDREISVLGS